MLLPLLFHGLPDPGDEPGAVLQEGLVGGSLPREQLEQDDAVAVDVALGGGPAGVEVLGREVAEGAGDEGGDVAGVGLDDERGEAEVGEARLHVVVQEDVTGLDVAVDHVRDAVVVEVGEAASNAQGDPVASRPVEDEAVGMVVHVQGLVQAAVGHQLVDEEVEVRGGVVAAERDDVAVLDVSHGVQLPLESAVVRLVVVGAPVEPLDGEGGLVVQAQAVDGAVAAGADDVLGGEAHEHGEEGLGGERLRHGHGGGAEDDHLAASEAVVDDPLLARPFLVEEEGDEHLGEEEEDRADGDVEGN